MSPHQIIAVAVRLFAIWLVAIVLMNVPYYFLNNSLENETDSVFLFVTGGAVLVLIAAVLWRFPLTVSQKLLSSPEAEPARPGEPDLWLAMGCALLGLWMLSSTVPSFFFDLVLGGSEYGPGYREAVDIWIGLYLPKTVIGLWLIFGAKGFRKLFWWARHAGRGA